MSNVQRSISIHDIDLSFSYEFHRFRMGISLTTLPGHPDLSAIRTTSHKSSLLYIAWAKSQFSSPPLGWSPTGRSASTVATFPRSPLNPHAPVTDESIHIATKFVGDLWWMLRNGSLTFPASSSPPRSGSFPLFTAGGDENYSFFRPP